jgi:hypothetical protein
MTVIAFSGYAGSGKDAVGRILVERHGYQRLAFADTLKNVLRDLDPITDDPHNGHTWRLHHDLEPWPGQTVDDPWALAKANLEVRELLQRLGIACRTHLGNDVWVDAVMRQIDADPTAKYCLTDTRFPNEALAVTRRGGQIWRIQRPGHGPVNGHVSETAIDAWAFDQRILNGGTLNDLADTVAYLLDTTTQIVAGANNRMDGV